MTSAAAARAGRQTAARPPGHPGAGPVDRVSVLARSRRARPTAGSRLWMTSRTGAVCRFRAVQAGTATPGAAGRGVEDHRGRQQDRQLERHVDGVPVGQPALQRGQAAGLRPHAVRDRAGEAESRAPAAGRCGSGCGRRTRRRSRCRSGGGTRQTRRRGRRGRGGGAGVPVRRTTRRLGALCAGTSSGRARPARRRPSPSATTSSCVPRSCGRRASARTGSETVAGRQRPAAARSGSPRAPGPSSGNGKSGRRHQRHGQREREHVRVGRRQLVAQPEAADPVVLARGARGRPRRRRGAARRSGSGRRRPRRTRRSAAAR